MGKGR
jgi:hypothetical protein